MKTKKQENHISRQLEEIQSFLKQKDQKPLNFVEAAQYLSISQSTLYKLTYQRKIPAHKPSGKLLYFFKHELDGWIRKNNSELKIENGDPSTSLRVTKKKKRYGRRLKVDEEEEDDDGG